MHFMWAHMLKVHGVPCTHMVLMLMMLASCMHFVWAHMPTVQVVLCTHIVLTLMMLVSCTHFVCTHKLSWMPASMT